MESKIISLEHDFIGINFRRNFNGNGYTTVGGNSIGRADCDGLQYRVGNSYGGGNNYTNLRENDISDPVQLDVLFFLSKSKKSFLSWDETWDLCNDEQKQHLLLFLPLRDTQEQQK